MLLRFEQKSVSKFSKFSKFSRQLRRERSQREEKQIPDGDGATRAEKARESMAYALLSMTTPIAFTMLCTAAGLKPSSDRVLPVTIDAKRSLAV